jgi:hypothetical protein
VIFPPEFEALLGQAVHAITIVRLEDNSVAILVPQEGEEPPHPVEVVSMLLAAADGTIRTRMPGASLLKIVQAFEEERQPERPRSMPRQPRRRRPHR